MLSTLTTDLTLTTDPAPLSLRLRKYVIENFSPDPDLTMTLTTPEAKHLRDRRLSTIAETDTSENSPATTGEKKSRLP